MARQKNGSPAWRKFAADFVHCHLACTGMKENKLVILLGARTYKSAWLVAYFPESDFRRFNCPVVPENVDTVID